jgi:hypothetical protein
MPSRDRFSQTKRNPTVLLAPCDTVHQTLLMLMRPYMYVHKVMDI